jgi:hypothetical protein
MKRFGLFATVLTASLLPFLTSAQSIDNLVNNVNPFSVSIAPQYPAPFSPVTLSFLSSSLDLTKATVTVSAGGKQVYQGSVQPVTLIVGKAGSITSVTITMSSATSRFTQSLVLQPEEVSLIAEPLASAPVLYPGKPLVPLEGNTRVVAIAHFADAAGRTIDPENLSFTWTVDGAVIANSSGIGKQAVIVSSPLQYRIRTVSVLVQSQMGSLVGKAEVSLAPQEPTIQLYENDPLLGIRFERALKSFYSLKGTETSLYAAPFSLPLLGGAPIVAWFLNGTKAQTGEVITLRPTGSGEGTASLSVNASGRTESLTSTGTSLSLQFGKTSTNFFGL